MIKMKHTHLTVLLAGILLTGVKVSRLFAADATTSDDIKSSREELREKLKNLTPEQRQAAIREWREKHPNAAARVKDSTNTVNAAKSLTPEEREARLKARRAVIENKVTQLQKKKADGTITQQESQQLERMEQYLKSGPVAPPTQKVPGDTQKVDGNAKPAATK